MNINLIRNLFKDKKTIFHCQTLEESRILLELASQFGYCWGDGKLFSEHDFWDIHRGNTCYNIAEGWYIDLTITRSNYKIVSVSNFLEDEPILDCFTEQEFKDGKVAIEFESDKSKEINAFFKACNPENTQASNAKYYFCKPNKDGYYYATNMLSDLKEYGITRTYRISELITEKKQSQKITIFNKQLNSNKDVDKSIKVQRVTPTIRQGERICGNRISGRTNKTAITSRPVINKAIIGC